MTHERRWNDSGSAYVTPVQSAVFSYSNFSIAISAVEKFENCSSKTYSQTMEGVYPSLHERFRNEGICPICMMAMGFSPKYSCINGHTVCHRCKPYYYACPTCRSPLDVHIPPPEVEGYHMPPAMHFMPHPYPPYPYQGNEPSAPFIDQEKYSWAPPTPTEDEELMHCGFCHAGCEARFPEHLRQIHESRCQFRPNLESEQLPTDLTCDEDCLRDCRYSIAGCNVRLPEWRKRIHEQTCIYKDKLEALDGIRDSLDQLSFGEEHGCFDPEELVDCVYRRHGCMVRMPRRRRSVHQRKCNYRGYHYGDEYEEERTPEPEVDPDQPVPCRWADHGCQVMPKYCRRDTHAEKCNYRPNHDCYLDHEVQRCPEPEVDPDQPVPCPWADQGCQVMPRYCRRDIHAEKCNYRM